MDPETLIASANRPIGTIMEEENESTNDSEAGPDPVMESDGNIICNAIHIGQGFNPFAEFPELFPDKKPTALPPYREPYEIMQHKIEPKPGAKWSPRYHTNYDRFQPQMMEKIRTELATGRIRPSSEPNTILLFTTPKKDLDAKGEPQPRYVYDAVPRNEQVNKPTMPMPSVKQIIEWLAGKNYRSKYDIVDGYHNIRMHEDSVKWTAFETMIGTFVSEVMQQGCALAPQTMMRAMSYLLRDYIGDTVMVYIDDILIGTDTYEEHVRITREIMQIMLDNLEIVCHTIV
jgi:hypothetical protein